MSYLLYNIPLGGTHTNPYLWPTHTKGGLGSVGSKVPIYVGLG